MILPHTSFLRFVVLFIAVFLLCYFGALMITGLAVPGDHYSEFIEKYFNIAAWIRSALISCSKSLLSVFGVATYRADEYILREVNGRGIRLVYSCLGFGVMSFWTAYIMASADTVKHKLLWLPAGLILIFIINVTRISLVLKTANSGRHFPFGWDHHTWFNIIAYIFMLGLIFLHERIASKANRQKAKGKGQRTTDD